MVLPDADRHPHAHACFLRFAAGDIWCGAAATPPPTRLTCCRTLHGSERRGRAGGWGQKHGGVYYACLRVVWELYFNHIQTRHRSNQVTIFHGRRCPGPTFPTAFKCIIVYRVRTSRGPSTSPHKHVSRHTIGQTVSVASPPRADTSINI